MENRKKVKVSYSCMENVSEIIKKTQQLFLQVRNPNRHDHIT